MGFGKYDAHTNIMIDIASHEEIERWKGKGSPIYIKYGIRYHIAETSAGIFRLILYRPLETKLMTRQAQYPDAKRKKNGKYSNPVALVTGRKKV